MTDTKFTPGPWTVGKAVNGNWIEASENGFMKTVGRTFYDDTGSATEDANAHLIAASPALYEALVEAREQILGLANARWSEVEASDAEMVGYIDAALAQARGES